MPDSNGLPTAAECIQKLDIVAPDTPEADLLGQVAPILSAVIADFQSPAGVNGDGGTGRRIVSVTETRVYDGSGTVLLRVDDIITLNSVTVGTGATSMVLSDVTVSDNNYGQGKNTLIRPNFPVQVYSPFLGIRRIFPAGIQNIAVNAVWGFPVGRDIYEAIRCETVYRLIIEGFVPLAGIGDEIKLSEYSYNSSAGVSVWRESSPIPILHKIYCDCVERYRDTRQMLPAPQRAVRRMY